MYGRLKNKEDRMENRKSYLNGYSVTEYEDANCVAGILDQNGRYYLCVFDGTAGRPSLYCYYNSAERRDVALHQHLDSRRSSIAAKKKRKEEKKAAGAYQIDTSKPYFEVGKKYFYSYSYDGDDYSAVIEIVGRTNCFVKLLIHGEENRVKVYADNNGEFIHWGYLYYFRAFNVLKSDEELEAERLKKQEEELKKQEEEQRLAKEISVLEIEECKHIENEYPLIGNEKFVIKVEWIEGYKDTCEYMDGREFTALAADKIFGMMDMSRKDMLGYDKCKFNIIMDGKTVLVDRYDLGDGYGGLMNFLKDYDYPWIDELRKERDAQAVGGEIVSVEVAPYITESIELIRIANSVAITISTVDELVELAKKQKSIQNVRALVAQTFKVDQEKGMKLYERIKPIFKEFEDS